MVVDRRSILETVGGVCAIGLSGCQGVGNPDEPSPTSAPERDPELAAPAFGDGEPIPRRFSCEGEDVSPELSIGGVPNDATSLALVVDDPDAPGRTFTHWLLWNIRPSTETVPQAVPLGETVEAVDGARQGTNDAGAVGYSGPCPPPEDGPHTYRFRLLALAERPELGAGADRAAFDDAIEGVGRSEAVLRGTYDR